MRHFMTNTIAVRWHTPYIHTNTITISRALRETTIFIRMYTRIRRQYIIIT